MRVRKVAAGVAIVLAGALALAGCSTGTTPAGTASGAPASSAPAGPVTMTFWTNATTGPGLDYMNSLVKSFETANPNVTINVQSIKDSDLDAKLQTALNAGQGSAPDIFFQRGGGKMVAQIQANQVADVTSLISADTTSGIGGGMGLVQFQGKTYGVPVSLQPEGFFYSKTLFQQAGVDATQIKTMDDLNAAVAKLKAANIVPIALGAKDAWPASHWFMQFALRECTQDVLNSTAASNPIQLTDPCWLKAAQDVQTFAATSPFNPGFLTTPGQTGATSSAGMVANHKAAMELMGSWDVGVIASLTPDQKPLPDLGFFPFPSVPGGQGDPTAMMQGGDMYSCSAWAPQPACANFLNFLATPDNQSAYAVAFNTLPINQNATIDPSQPAVMQDILSTFKQAKYTSIWLDTLYGANVGGALNNSIVSLLAGKTDPQGVITAINAAASKG